MFSKKTIRDIDVQGKRVLLRADFNVPLEHGRVTSDYRISQTVPTIKELLAKNVRLVIISHLGRPDGKPSPEFSLRPVVNVLSELLGVEVKFAADCVGPVAEEAVRSLQPGQVLLLENLRFHAEEEANDVEFAKKLASYADVFVEDGFGVVHRAHTSTEGVTKFLPSVAGLLLEKEVNTITEVMNNPKRPVMAIVGGAKISDKLEVLKKVIDLADVVAVGGAMANTFLKARGIDVAKSKYDEDDLPTARDILAMADKKRQQGRFVFFLPQDGVVATKMDKTASTRIVDWDAHVIAEIESYPKQPSKRTREVNEDEMILDIGPFSGAFIAGAAQLVNTVIWNGTMGVTETPAVHGPVGPFAHGTEMVVDALLGEFGHKPFSVVGGGDTVGYVEERKLTASFGHVSTGGGASLDLMSGHPLPGVDALENK